MFKLLLILFIPICSFGQFRARVLDSATRQPISFATVRFIHPQKGLLRSAFADSSGQFTWTDTTIHIFEISATGYQKKRFNSFQQEYLLHSIARTLDSAIVTGQRRVISIRPDGFVYDATQDIQAAGETTTDLLNKLPGVQVDPNGVPSMRGSTRIKVFIDGKPSDTYASSIADALRMIPASNILKIEIITQPSARYEGEGVDGVLQIYTKRPLADGASGNISGYYQNRNRLFNGNIAVRRRKWIFTGDLNVNDYNNLGWTTITRTETSGNTITQQTTRTNKLLNIFAAIGVTYLPDSLTTISVGIRYGRAWDNIDSRTEYFTGSSTFTRLIDNPYRRILRPVSWSYIRKSKNKKGEFSFLGNWFNHDIHIPYDLQQGNYKESNYNSVWVKELILEANYSYGGFEAGARANTRNYRNESIFIPDEAKRSQHFTFPRDIYAAYVSQTVTLKGFKIRGGLRYEQTIQSLKYPDSSIRIPDYKNPLPNLLVSRAFGAHSLSAAYSRKIVRPYLGALSPIINYMDSFNISYGNPYLEPEYANNYDLTYSYIKKKWLVTANFFWYQTLNSFESIALLKPGGIVARTYVNIAEWSVSGLSLQVSYRTPKLTVNVNNNIRYIDFKTTAGWVNNFTANAMYKFNAGWSVSVYALLNGKRTDLQGTTTGTRYYNIWFYKNWANGKYGLSFRIDNLFMHYQTISEVSKTENFTVVSENKQIRRFFRFGFSYKFGKKEVKVPASRAVTTEN
jgi:outer membrane receptor protein involved in Fe transport